MSQKKFAYALLVITCGHLLVGLMLFHQVFYQIIMQGWVNVIGYNYIEGAAAVWFVLFSFPLLLIVTAFWPNDNVQVPKAFLISSIIGAIFCLSLMPVSGFWLLLALSVFSLFSLNSAQEIS